MKIVSESDIGLCRAENQDIVNSEMIGDSVFVVLCDGMGGENSGRDASRIISEVVMNKFVAEYEDRISEQKIKDLMFSSLTVANTVVYNTAHVEPDKSGMGSTCVAAFVEQATDTAYIINVGDSRAYLCSNDKIEQITVDHSFVQMLINEGKLTEAEKNDHPKKNMLIRAVGVEKKLEIDYFKVKLDGKKLLLCSDGLHGCCSDEDILKVLNTSSFEDSAAGLKQLALDSGGFDNVTLAVVENC